MKKSGKKRPSRPAKLLKGTRAYLSGPMDFVASRATEAKFGWRTRVGEFLKAMEVTVFDPWNKSAVRGLFEYGREGVDTTNVRKAWNFEPGAGGATARARCSGKFWETLHIDLRMVDTSDFVIAYCPTNIYSVGTPHEIVISRQQRKPVLFVSPPVQFTTLEQLRKHLAHDRKGLALLERVAHEVPIKENLEGIPSLWYMPLVGAENFFDGFGFAPYVKRFHWHHIPLDDYEDQYEVKKPLLPFLEEIHSGMLPKRWDNRLKRFIRNDDWLLWDLAPDRQMMD